MPLLLKQVEAASGGRWLRDAFALYRRRPFGFTMLFVVFMFAWLLLAVVPVVGGVLQTAMPPLLSLGFMIASQSALLDGPVHPSQFIAPMRGNPKRRNALLLLCALYGASVIAIYLLSDGIAGGGLSRLWQLRGEGDAQPQEVQALLTDASVSAGVLVFSGLLTALTVPFWHAPALVFWGDQGVGQALFSSTLAVWRSKGAFLVYAMAWMGVGLAVSVGVTLLSLLLGRGLVQWLAMAAGLFLSTLFYVSLLFTFNDSFGGAEGRVKP